MKYAINEPEMQARKKILFSWVAVLWPFWLERKITFRLHSFVVASGKDTSLSLPRNYVRSCDSLYFCPVADCHVNRRDPLALLNIRKQKVFFFLCDAIKIKFNSCDVSIEHLPELYLRGDICRPKLEQLRRCLHQQNCGSGARHKKELENSVNDKSFHVGFHARNYAVISMNICIIWCRCFKRSFSWKMVMKLL